jgi:hypothetical protein
MPKKPTQTNEGIENDKILQLPNKEQSIDETGDLTRMLAAVLDYLSDEEVEVIDLEYILDHTEGLRDWWNRYRESNRKLIEEEIRDSLSELSLEELEKIREQIKEKQND